MRTATPHNAVTETSNLFTFLFKSWSESQGQWPCQWSPRGPRTCSEDIYEVSAHLGLTSPVSSSLRFDQRSWEHLGLCFWQLLSQPIPHSECRPHILCKRESKWCRAGTGQAAAGRGQEEDQAVGGVLAAGETGKH